jgi:nucleotide-binding universal stress UspA family protein
MKSPAKSARAFRTILCPVDLSATSKAAAQTAAVIADQFDAELAVIFVEDPLLARAALRYDEDELARRTKAELARFVEKAIGARKRCSYEIATGKAAEEVLKAARRLGADLIVMGTQGQRAPRRLFFGSTAESVLRASTIPVLAVPPRSR